MASIIRRAVTTDAGSITNIIEGIAAERVYTAIDEPWSAEEQARYIASLGPREAVFVAEEGAAVIGYQVLELWAPTLHSMSHVGQVGTFLRPQARGRGVGGELFRATAAFARGAGYGKFVIQVRGSNEGARRFYQRLGFRACGRLSRQVRIDGQEDDEILMEFFL